MIRASIMELLLIDRVVFYETLVLLERQIWMEQLLSIDFGHIGLVVILVKFIVLIFQLLLVRWLVFITKILRLCGHHWIGILIFSLLQIIRIPHSSSFCTCFCSSPEHGIKYLYHVWCFRMVVKLRSGLSALHLLVVYRPIEGVRDCSNHWSANLGGKPPKIIWKHPSVTESKWLALFSRKQRVDVA